MSSVASAGSTVCMIGNATLKKLASVAGLLKERSSASSTSV